MSVTSLPLSLTADAMDLDANPLASVSLKRSVISSRESRTSLFSAPRSNLDHHLDTDLDLDLDIKSKPFDFSSRDPLPASTPVARDSYGRPILQRSSQNKFKTISAPCEFDHSKSNQIGKLPVQPRAPLRPNATGGARLPVAPFRYLARAEMHQLAEKKSELSEKESSVRDKAIKAKIQELKERSSIQAPPVASLTLASMAQKSIAPKYYGFGLDSSRAEPKHVLSLQSMAASGPLSTMAMQGTRTPKQGPLFSILEQRTMEERAIRIAMKGMHTTMSFDETQPRTGTLFEKFACYSKRTKCFLICSTKLKFI